MMDFGVDVEAKPKVYGGAQRLTLVNGRIIPLAFSKGGLYIPMKRPTQEQLENLEWLYVNSEQGLTHSEADDDEIDFDHPTWFETEQVKMEDSDTENDPDPGALALRSEEPWPLILMFQRPGHLFGDLLLIILRGLGWEQTKAVPGFWYREKPDHFELMAVWPDILITASKEPKQLMEEIVGAGIPLKGDAPPSYYLDDDFLNMNHVMTFGPTANTTRQILLAALQRLFIEMCGRDV